MVKKLVVTFTMRPQPWATIGGSAARVMRNAPMQLTSNIRRQWSGVISHQPDRLREMVLADRAHPDPGVVDQDVEAAVAGAHAGDRHLAVLRAGDIGLNPEHVLGAGRERRVVQIEHRHLGADRAQADGDRRADAARAAGDQRDLARR